MKSNNPNKIVQVLVLQKVHSGMHILFFKKQRREQQGQDLKASLNWLPTLESKLLLFSRAAVDEEPLNVKLSVVLCVRGFVPGYKSWRLACPRGWVTSLTGQTKGRKQIENNSGRGQVVQGLKGRAQNYLDLSCMTVSNGHCTCKAVALQGWFLQQHLRYTELDHAVYLNIQRKEGCSWWERR